MVWIMTARTLAALRADPTAAAVLARGTVYELVGAGGHDRVGAAVTPTRVFDSLDTMRAALSAGGVQSWVKAVLYDDEHWRFTPVAEQRTPAASIAAAAMLARQGGRTLLASPALDLAGVLSPSRGTPASAYLDLGLAGGAARHAAIVDVQAQDKPC